MGPVPALLDRRLLFFTGKGGVGKSTVTAATALLAAERGKRVLLVEVDAKGNLTALFEHAAGRVRAAPVHPGVWAMQMDTEASLREYLKVQARVPVFGRIGPLARAFDFVANAAPGVKEILTDRQGVLGAAGVARGPGRLGPHRRRRRGHRPCDQPARRARARSRSSCTSGRSASRPTGWSSCSTIPRSPRSTW